MNLNIVLVEPEIPQNTGNIARTCAALGANLHLIHPLGFKVDEKSVRRAGLDYWNLLNVTEYDSLDHFLSTVSIDQCRFVTTKAPSHYAEASYPDPCYLLFGKESAGLPETLLSAHRELCVRIPMREEARSLNLSNAAAIMAYEVLRQKNFPGLQTGGELHRLEWTD